MSSSYIINEPGSNKDEFYTKENGLSKDEWKEFLDLDTLEEETEKIYKLKVFVFNVTNRKKWTKVIDWIATSMNESEKKKATKDDSQGD